MAGYNGSVFSVGTVLEQAGSSLDPTTIALLTEMSSPDPTLAPPAVGPPYVPLPVSHQNIDSNPGGVVPDGGHNYAAP